MANIIKVIKAVVASHKVASIAVASCAGVSLVGAGGVAIYNNIAAEPETVVQEDIVQKSNADVYIPTFVKAKLSGDSVEKDLTLYISDLNDQVITGTEFQVKLIPTEDAEALQPYVDAIADVNKQIAEYTGEEVVDTTAIGEESEDSSKESDSKEESTKEESKESDADSEEETETTEKSSEESGEKTPADYLEERNPDVTVTDENGEVVETLSSSILEDPLYELYLDKETAIQAYIVALEDIEGTVYTDDDSDGVIKEEDLEPGNFVACLVEDAGADSLYDMENFATPVEVKDKVEFKVQKEITKEIKKDVASEDGQKKAAVPVENTLKDTVEFVESRKVENGSTGKATTNAVAPKNTASSSKASVKDKGVTEVTHTMAKTQNTYTITIKYVCEKETIKESELKHCKSGEDYNVKPPEISGYTYSSAEGDALTGKADCDKNITLKYNKNESKTDTQSGGSSSDSKGEKTGESEEQNKQSTEETEKQQTEEQTIVDPNNQTEEVIKDVRAKHNRALAVFNRKTATGALALRMLQSAAQDTTTEKATLNMSYSKGVFTISATTNVGSVAVNGTAVTMKDGKGSFTATKDGDYKLTGTATFSDKNTDSTLNITYTVSGYGTASTDRLKDSDGNELFLDEACTQPATAANYEKGKTYYYKCPTYTYYGWQTIDGSTYYYDKNGVKVTGSQVIQGVAYDFGSDGVLVVKGTGIDVSKYQGNIDWKAAKSAVSFAIVRCGYRGMYDGQLHEDPYFYKNMSGAKAAGVNVGVYIYSTALNEGEAVQEASMAVAMAQKAGGCSYPIYIDMEDTVRGQSSLSTAQRMAIVNAFVSTVQSSGYKAGLYCSKNWMTARMDAGSVPSSCSVWIAQYNTTCTYSGRKNMWQYSSKGSVPGIKGNVDMNKSF